MELFTELCSQFSTFHTLECRIDQRKWAPSYLLDFLPELCLAWLWSGSDTGRWCECRRDSPCELWDPLSKLPGAPKWGVDCGSPRQPPQDETVHIQSLGTGQSGLAPPFFLQPGSATYIGITKSSSFCWT